MTIQRLSQGMGVVLGGGVASLVLRGDSLLAGIAREGTALRWSVGAAVAVAVYGLSVAAGSMLAARDQARRKTTRSLE